jgi:hypothetical protein
MPALWTPFIVLAAALLPLLWVKTWITHSLQELSLRWTGDPAVAMVFYFVLVLPGVVVHELSHWLMATLLGVRVSKLSLGPVPKGRSGVSLGSVRVAKVDPLRASLIGVAPLLGATAVILLIGRLVLGLDDIVARILAGDSQVLLAALADMVRVPDFWLWLYLIFAISNAMLPSASDMMAVRPVLIFLGLLAAVMLLVGGIPAIPAEAVRSVGAVAGYLASAFALTLAADGVFVVVIALLLWLTRRVQDY